MTVCRTPLSRRRCRRAGARAAVLAATVSAVTVLLAGCSSTPGDPRLDWTPDARCPSPAAVSTAGDLGGLRFTVATAHAETPNRTGCSYRDTSGDIRVDLSVEPGPPSGVQFGSAAQVTDTKEPALGAGAHLGRSSTYCSVAVPEVHDGTIQLDIVAGVSAVMTEARACARLVPLLKGFAHQGRTG